MLTHRQLAVLRVINDRIKAEGIAPTFTEIMAETGLTSRSSLFKVMQALEEKGFIRRMANRKQAVEILKLPDILDKAGQLPILADCMRMEHATYLGDGAYAGIDRGQIWVFTHDGIQTTNMIAIPNDGTLQAFVDYARKHGQTA